MVVGAMIASDFVGRKGRWLVLATVLTISVVSILANGAVGSKSCTG